MTLTLMQPLVMHFPVCLDGWYRGEDIHHHRYRQLCIIIETQPCVICVKPLLKCFILKYTPLNHFCCALLQ